MPDAVKSKQQQQQPQIKRFLIGRSAEQCDIVIDDPQRTVSSVHAELFLDSMNRWYVLDRNSRNGTFINRGEHWERFKQDFVEPGQQLAFSNVVYEVSWLIEQAQRLSPRVVQPHEEKVEADLDIPEPPQPIVPPAEAATQRSYTYERGPDGKIRKVPVSGGGRS